MARVACTALWSLASGTSPGASLVSALVLSTAAHLFENCLGAWWNTLASFRVVQAEMGGLSLVDLTTPSCSPQYVGAQNTLVRVCVAISAGDKATRHISSPPKVALVPIRRAPFTPHMTSFSLFWALYKGTGGEDTDDCAGTCPLLVLLPRSSRVSNAVLTRAWIVRVALCSTSAAETWSGYRGDVCASSLRCLIWAIRSDDRSVWSLGGEICPTGC